MRRNWIDLPRDVMILIFSKLGTVAILCRAQFVCTSWQQLSHERDLCRSVYLRNEEEPTYLGNEQKQQYKYPSESAVKILQKAVDRSCGELIEISIGSHWCTNRLLHYVVQKSKSLKVLRLSILTCITERGLMEAFKSLPLLEEFDMTSNHPYSEALKELGRSCTRLKNLRLQHGPHGVWGCRLLKLDIAEYYPQLQGLSLTRMALTDKELRDILEKCSFLKNLNFCECYGLDTKEDLQKKCLDKFGCYPPSKCIIM